jgi:hypothetical protein
MSYYDDSSLFFSPNGYKASVLFAQKPMDANGQLTFTRASSATRVQSDGLIEKVRTNVLTYSQDFSNASWTVDPLLTRTLNQTDPNGGTTAALYTATSGTNLTLGKNVTLVANAPNTVSIYIKGNASGSVSLRIDDSTLGPQTNINYTTNWQRFSVTRTVNQASCVFVVGGFSSWGTGENLSFAFAQAEAGDIATDYIPTTTAAVSVGPVSGLPRLDYLGSTCPRLLLEPQRTNLVTFSEQFDNAGWTKTNATITANNAISPDGYQNADKLIPASASQGILQQNHSITAGQTNTLSVFAKYDGLNDNFALNSRDNASAANAAQIAFNLSTGTIATAATASGSYSAASGTITPYGNGWYRLTLTHTSSISTTTRFRYFNEAGSGDGTNGYLVYGAQAELNASYATSYIPTLAASVTRVADVCSKTGISSLIGQTEGTVFLDLQISANATRALFSIDIGTTTNYVAATTNATSQVRVAVNQAGSATNIITSSALTLGRHKLAIAYKSGDYALYIDGVQAAVSASTLYPVGTLTQFVLNNASYGSLGDGYSQALLFKTRLTNSELSQLTTL